MCIWHDNDTHNTHVKLRLALMVFKKLFQRPIPFKNTHRGLVSYKLKVFCLNVLLVANILRKRGDFYEPSFKPSIQAVLSQVPHIGQGALGLFS